MHFREIILKVTARLLSDLTGSRGRYFRVAVTFGYIENVCNLVAVSRKKDTVT